MDTPGLSFAAAADVVLSRFFVYLYIYHLVLLDKIPDMAGSITFMPRIFPRCFLQQLICFNDPDLLAIYFVQQSLSLSTNYFIYSPLSFQH